LADDTIIIISSKNLGDFCILSNKVLSQTINGFLQNKLSLSLQKINILNFITKNSPQYPLNMGHNDKDIKEALNTKLIIV
jgi:hypothetical protein